MKLGIVGSGWIVKDLLLALQEVDCVEVTAICVRPHSQDKGEALAQEYKIPKVYTDYADFLATGDFDFAYIGIVNSMHYAYTKQALQADRNVIVEKPFASTLAEAMILAELAKEKGLFLIEAVSLLHMPNFAKIQELLPQLGQLKLVQANYSQYSSRYDRYLAGNVQPAFDPSKSGGALYDINIYNINLISGLLGEPGSINYVPNIGPNGIDTSGVLLLKYPEFTAVSIGAKDSGSPCGCILQSDKGYIQTHGAPNELTSFTFALRGEEPQEFSLNKYQHRLAHEFAAFAAMLENNDLAMRDKYLEQSIIEAKIAELGRKSAGIIFPADKDE